MRLFVAAYPPEHVLDDLAQFAAGLSISGRVGVNTRPTLRSLWHVTLAFIGEVDEGLVSPASEAIDRAAQDARARPTVWFGGGGRFGRGRTSLVWAGLAGDTAGLAEISTGVRRALRARRCPYDRKPFAPHLTLARPGDRLPAEAIAADIAALTDYRGPEWIPTSIDLVESHLGPAPWHETVHRAPLPRAGS